MPGGERSHGMLNDITNGQLPKIVFIDDWTFQHKAISEQQNDRNHGSHYDWRQVSHSTISETLVYRGLHSRYSVRQITPFVYLLRS